MIYYAQKTKSTPASVRADGGVDVVLVPVSSQQETDPILTDRSPLVLVDELTHWMEPTGVHSLEKLGLMAAEDRVKRAEDKIRLQEKEIELMSLALKAIDEEAECFMAHIDAKVEAHHAEMMAFAELHKNLDELHYKVGPNHPEYQAKMLRYAKWRLEIGLVTRRFNVLWDLKQRYRQDHELRRNVFFLEREYEIARLAEFKAGLKQSQQVYRMLITRKSGLRDYDLKSLGLNRNDNKLTAAVIDCPLKRVPLEKFIGENRSLGLRKTPVENGKRGKEPVIKETIVDGMLLESIPDGVLIRKAHKNDYDRRGRKVQFNLESPLGKDETSSVASDRTRDRLSDSSSETISSRLAGLDVIAECAEKQHEKEDIEMECMDGILPPNAQTTKRRSPVTMVQSLASNTARIAKTKANGIKSFAKTKIHLPSYSVVGTKHS